MEYREHLLLKHVPQRGTYKHWVLTHLLYFLKKSMQFKAKIFQALKTRGYRFVILTQPVSARIREAPRTCTEWEMLAQRMGGLLLSRIWALAGSSEPANSPKRKQIASQKS